MLSEYDFTGKQGVRGKYYQALQQGYTVTIHQEDGTTVVQQVSPPDGTVQLDPDVQEYFPDSTAVNQALRAFIALIPKREKQKASRTRAGAKL